MMKIKLISLASMAAIGIFSANCALAMHIGDEIEEIVTMRLISNDNEIINNKYFKTNNEVENFNYFLGYGYKKKTGSKETKSKKERLDEAQETCKKLEDECAILQKWLPDAEEKKKDIARKVLQERATFTPEMKECLNGAERLRKLISRYTNDIDILKQALNRGTIPLTTRERQYLLEEGKKELSAYLYTKEMINELMELSETRELAEEEKDKLMHHKDILFATKRSIHNNTIFLNNNSFDYPAVKRMNKNDD